MQTPADWENVPTSYSDVIKGCSAEVKGLWNVKLTTYFHHDHVRKIRDRKKRTDIGKYSSANRTIENWNQVPAEPLETFICKPKTFREVGKV